MYKSFGKTRVLEDISLSVAEGEVVSLLGPSGCGKTTTLKIIAGLLEPDSGEVLVGGEVMNQVPIDRRGAVIVFQDHLLFPHLSVAENIGFGLKMAGRPRSVIQGKVRAMLDLVQLSGYGQRYPSELSGGQQQRVALARALAIEPRVLLLDEPFSSLDPKLRDSVRDLTLDIQQQLGITTLLVTHDKEEALMSSHRIAVMLDGRICQLGTPEELYRAPLSLEVANFISDNNHITGQVEAQRFSSNLFELPVDMEDAQEAVALIRPEDIVPGDEGELKGRVIGRRYAGDRTWYDIQVGEQVLKAKAPSLPSLTIGDEVHFTLDRENILVFRKGVR